MQTQRVFFKPGFTGLAGFKPGYLGTRLMFVGLIIGLPDWRAQPVGYCYHLSVKTGSRGL